MRVVQIGLGGWGRDWLRSIVPTAPQVEAVALVDPAPGALARAQAESKMPAERCFPSLAAAFETLGPDPADAALITAALPGHVPNALAALDAGLHVLMEKPFAPSLAEARQVVETAARRERILMISQNYRFHPAVRAAQALIAEGTLGPLGGVSVDFRRWGNDAPPSDWYYAIQQPLLMDMAIHHFDLMRAVLGQRPQSVTCHAWNPAWSNYHDPAAAFATITFDGGAVVSYRGSWVSPAPQTAWAGEWSMECAGGEIAWTSRGGAGDRVVVRPRGEPEREQPLPTLRFEDRAGSLAAFVHAVETGEEPETSGRDNLGSVALMFAAIESAQTGEPRPVTADAR